MVLEVVLKVLEVVLVVLEVVLVTLCARARGDPVRDCQGFRKPAIWALLFNTGANQIGANRAPKGLQKDLL